MSRLADRYTIVRELGRGRASVVYEAHDDELDQRIAIEVIDREHLADPETAERMRRELAAAHRVTHPNVCRVFDADVGAGLCTMELLVGETLEQRLEREPMPADLAASIVAQLERALTAIHAAGVAHGDVRPRNIMLCADRAVLVGLGKRLTATVAADRAALRAIARSLGVARRGVPRRSGIAIGAALVVVLGGALVLQRASRNAPSSGGMVERRSGAVARWLELDGAGKEMIDGVARDAAGNLYLCGHVSAGSRLAGRALAHPGGGAMLGVVAAFDRGGGPRWHRMLASGSRVAAATIAVDGDLVVVSGRFNDGVIDLGGGARLVADGTAGFVIALSASDGAIRWGRAIAATSATVKVSGIGPDGAIYVAGEYHGTLTLDGAGTLRANASSHYVASFDRDGNPRWVTAASDGPDARTHALTFRDGAVIVAGGFTTDRGWGALVSAFEQASGELRWTRPIAGKDAFARGMTASGALVVVGEREAENRNALAWIVELDTRTGGVRWERALGRGPSLQLRVVALLSDGRLAIAGELYVRAELGGQSFDTVGLSDVFVAILGADGTPARVTVLRGPGRERIKAAFALPDGVLAVHGHHQGLTIGDLSLRGDGYSDGFYAELRLDQLFAPASASGSR